MKLNLVVASMSIFGVISFPVFAATQTSDQTQTSSSMEASSTTPEMMAKDMMPAKKHHGRKHHSKHHKMMKKHHHKGQMRMMKEESREEMMEARQHDYKAMSLPVEPVCIISQNAMILDQMTQNIGRSMPTPCNAGWADRIRISGGIVVDAGKWGNRNANITGENYQRLSLNDAYLNVGAVVNDWAKGFASLSFSNPTTNVNPSIYNSRGAAQYDAAYANNINGNANNTIQLEQAYATLGNFDVSPLFLQIGKQFQDHGRYTIHPITESMTQVLTETLATSIKGGFIAYGFNGSIAAFDDPLNKIDSASKPTNYVAALGYEMPNDQFGWDVGASYIYNMIGANNVAYNVNNFSSLSGAMLGGYRNHVDAYALYADVNAGPFTVAARFTQALQRFNVNDLPKHGIADLTGGVITGTPMDGTHGAKPWAVGVQAGYGFMILDKSQNVYVGYQTSRETAGLNLPKTRYLAGYNIDIVNNWNVGIEWDHDNAFNVAHGGAGRNSNLVTLRSDLQFA